LKRKIIWRGQLIFYLFFCFSVVAIFNWIIDNITIYSRRIEHYYWQFYNRIPSKYCIILLCIIITTFAWNFCSDKKSGTPILCPAREWAAPHRFFCASLRDIRDRSHQGGCRVGMRRFDAVINISIIRLNLDENNLRLVASSIIVYIIMCVYRHIIFYATFPPARSVRQFPLLSTDNCDIYIIFNFFAHDQ